MPPNKTARNEQRKVLANFFTGLAVASFASGVLVPLLVANSAPSGTADLGYLVTLPIGTFFAMCFLYLARLTLHDWED